MEIDSKIVYTRVSKKNNKDLNYIKSIGDVLFKSINESIRTPENLILNLQGLGRFTFRRKKTMQALENTLKKYYVDGEIRTPEGMKPLNESKINAINIQVATLKRMLKIYDTFLEDKKIIKQLRYKDVTI